MKQKKAQGLSINTIIIAAISLIVLIVIIFIFSNKSSNFVSVSGNCESQGSDCNSVDTEGNCISGYTFNPAGKCENENKCCMKIVENP